MKEIGVKYVLAKAQSELHSKVLFKVGADKVILPPPQNWVDKSLKDLSIRAKYGISILAVKGNSSINVSPKADYVIKEDDLLVIIGSNSDIRRLGYIE